MPDRSSLEDRFRTLTALLYDTSVPPDRLEREVMPFIAEEIRFTDPWQSEGGKAQYRTGLAGFHAMFRFQFELAQVSVQLAPDGSGGRALVDGVMQLRLLAPLFTYPLRTILHYDFRFTANASGEAGEGAGGEPSFEITAHEEMWSFGDMIAAVPLLGRFYARTFRPAFSQGFLQASLAAARIRFGKR